MQYRTFGQFIKHKREMLGYGLNEFAFECEIEPASLCRFEKLERDMYFQNVVKIAHGFNMSFSELLNEYEKINL